MAAVCTCGLGPNINVKALFRRKSAGLKQLQKYHGCHWEFWNSDKLSEHRGGRFEQEKIEKVAKVPKIQWKDCRCAVKIRRKDPRDPGTPHPQPIACTVQMPRDKQADLGSRWDQRHVLTILASSGRWCLACGRPSLGWTTDVARSHVVEGRMI